MTLRSYIAFMLLFLACSPAAKRPNANRSSEVVHKPACMQPSPPLNRTRELRHFRKILCRTHIDIQELKSIFQVEVEGPNVVVPAPTEFPANRWYDSACGGTLVWNNVMITAAHCIENDYTVLILVSGTEATCTCDPDYTVAGAPHDVAACTPTIKGTTIDERLYETVDLNQTSVVIHDPIMLTG